MPPRLGPLEAAEGALEGSGRADGGGGVASKELYSPKSNRMLTSTLPAAPTIGDTLRDPEEDMAPEFAPLCGTPGLGSPSHESQAKLSWMLPVSHQHIV